MQRPRQAGPLQQHRQVDLQHENGRRDSDDVICENNQHGFESKQPDDIDVGGAPDAGDSACDDTNANTPRMDIGDQPDNTGVNARRDLPAKTRRESNSDPVASDEQMTSMNGICGNELGEERPKSSAVTPDPKQSEEAMRMHLLNQKLQFKRQLLRIKQPRQGPAPQGPILRCEESHHMDANDQDEMSSPGRVRHRSESAMLIRVDRRSTAGSEHADQAAADFCKQPKHGKRDDQPQQELDDEMIDPELDDDALDPELDEDQPASHYQPHELELHDNRSAVDGRPPGLKFNQGESKTAKHSPEYEALCCEIRQAHEQHFDLEVHLDGTFEHGNENFNVSYCGMYRKDRSPPYKWMSKKLLRARTTLISIEAAENIRRAAFDILGFMVYNGQRIHPGVSLRQLEEHEHRSTSMSDGQVPSTSDKAEEALCESLHTQERQQELSDKTRSTRQSASRCTSPSGALPSARHVHDIDQEPGGGRAGFCRQGAGRIIPRRPL